MDGMMCQSLLVSLDLEMVQEKGREANLFLFSRLGNGVGERKRGRNKKKGGGVGVPSDACMSAPKTFQNGRSGYAARGRDRMLTHEIAAFRTRHRFVLVALRKLAGHH